MKKLLLLFLLIILTSFTICSCALDNEKVNDGKDGSDGKQGVAGINSVLFLDPPKLLFEGISSYGEQSYDLSDTFIGKAIYGVKITNLEEQKKVKVLADLYSVVIESGNSVTLSLITEDNTFNFILYQSKCYCYGNHIKLELVFYGQ